VANGRRHRQSGHKIGFRSEVSNSNPKQSRASWTAAPPFSAAAPLRTPLPAPPRLLSSSSPPSALPILCVFPIARVPPPATSRRRDPGSPSLPAPSSPSAHTAAAPPYSGEPFPGCRDPASPFQLPFPFVHASTVQPTRRAAQSWATQSAPVPPVEAPRLNQKRPTHRDGPARPESSHRQHLPHSVIPRRVNFQDSLLVAFAPSL
ncbi:hypothetical protein Taro_014748, partial [Colocasia esculenta]|nr:hypothetical protein [Colocasia esculenta]